MGESFEDMLTGGHPNSLGRTVEVVDIVLADKARLADLFATYGSDDEVVRLRVSSALKRVQIAQPDWIAEWKDHLLDEVSKVDQPSARWTQAQMFRKLRPELDDARYRKAKDILSGNLGKCDDWIVQCETMNTLAEWAQSDADLRAWLTSYVKGRMSDPRKTVARKAAKFYDELKTAC